MEANKKFGVPEKGCNWQKNASEQQPKGENKKKMNQIHKQDPFFG